jgi:hypothetical protein
MIDQKLQSYYENQFSMMATPGWKEFVEDAEQMFKALNNVLPIQTEQELQLKRGQLDILNWVISRKAVAEQTYEQLMSGDSGNES